MAMKKMADTMRRTKTAQPKKELKLKDNFDGYVLMFPMLFVLYIMVWRPTVMGFAWSFCKMQGYHSVGFAGFDNYIKVLTHTQFVPILINTVKYVLWSMVIGFLPPFLIAVVLNEMLHMRSTLRMLIYLPVVIPGVCAMLIWYFMYQPDSAGLFNIVLSKFGIQPYAWLNDPKFAIVGIIIYSTWKGFGGSMLLYYATVQGISTELYEAAIIDGAGMLKRFWHITVPESSGVLLLCAVNQIIGVFQILEQPLAMTGGGPNGASTSLSYQLYQYGFNSGGKATGQAMALGVIMFVILLVATVYYFKLDKKIQEKY